MLGSGRVLDTHWALLGRPSASGCEGRVRVTHCVPVWIAVNEGGVGSVVVAFAEQDRAEQGRDGAGQGRRRPIEAIEVEATQGITEA